MNEAARSEYLKKIRAVELVDTNGGTVLDAGSEGAPTSSFSGPPPTVGSASYEIPEIKSWPNKIVLPSGQRKDYNIAAGAFAQGIDITGSELFALLDSKKFDVRNPRFKGEGYVRKDFAFYLEELHAVFCSKVGLEKLIITSSFRSRAHNDWIYKDHSPEKKVTNSPHLGGIAVDVSVSGQTRYELADTAYYMGFGGIAIGDNFVHIDIAPKSTWKYDGTPEYYSPERKYG